jgi:acyl dehydratase
MEIRDLEELRAQIGREVAISDWVALTQEQIDLFAEATGNRDRAHGFLLLSLVPRLAAGTLTLPETKLVVNYGLNRVRFPAPVRAGQRIRARFSPTAIEDVPSGVQLTWTVTVEAEGNDAPACVLESVSRRYAR